MSVSRFLSQLYSQDRNNIRVDIITHILKHGSLFKHEILALMSNYKQSEVEQTI